jgi:predicted O-methyltransferase YrrM
MTDVTVTGSRMAIGRMVKAGKRLLSRILTVLILPFARLTAICLRLSHNNVMFNIFAKEGFYVLSKNYYQPIPQEEDMHDSLWDNPSEMVGLDMNDTYALNLLDSVFPAYIDEFRKAFPLHKSSSDQRQFYLINSNFMAIDAHIYYMFIRYFQPKRIIEIGAGNSTILAAAACRQNSKESGKAPHLTAIDPYPRSFLKEGVDGLSQLVEDRVQNTDLQLFASLEAGDILFIDSSHVLRSGGDVQFEYCEILPRLASGVLVHIHDISLPKHYPRVYYQNRLFFNEQYVLQTFLCFNSGFEVIWAGNYMILKYPDKVCALFPEYHDMSKAFPMSEPSSFWMRVKS